MSYKPYNDPYSKNDTSMDAWGRPKIYLDKSLLSGVFTFNVPNLKYVIEENGTEILNNLESTKVYSNKGRMTIDSGINLNDSSYVRTRVNAKYQANRGQLISMSCAFPNHTLNGIREFGLFNEENGVFFRLKTDGLYAVIRDDGVDKIEEKINIPFIIDLSKGNIYDIQFQWRGVGNYKFFIGNPTTDKIELVHEIKFLNTSNELTIYNPSLPFAAKSKNLGDSVSFWVGCFDVTSEGGGEENKIYNGVGTDLNGVVLSNNKLYEILAIKIEKLSYTNKINTINAILTRIILSARDENKYEIITTRDDNAFVGTTWSDADYNNNVKSAEGTNIVYTPTNYTYTIIKGRSEIDIKNEIVNNSNTKFYLTAGDYILIRMRTDGSSKRAWANIEWTDDV